MSYKGSKSRVEDQKAYDETMDAIRNQKRISKVVRVTKGKSELHGSVTRYHFDEKPPEKMGDAPGISHTKSTPESTVENL